MEGKKRGVRAKPIKSEKITLTLSPNNPVESVMIDAWRSQAPIQVGHGEYVEGVEVLRRLLLRGYTDLRREFPDALPSPKVGQLRSTESNESAFIGAASS